jgi:predicted transcriptional regulator/gamma-glutamylcysteine synthetase
MGETDVAQTQDNEQLRVFTRAVLEDVRALERMLASGSFETGTRRIGAEQEVFLVDGAGRPTLTAPEMLGELPPEFFTTELARFNLELNLSPRELGGDCLSAMENELTTRLAQMREVAARHRTDVVLCGILPTLQREHLSLEAMTPNPRYHLLNRVLRHMRGGEFHTYIKGVDELNLRHDNVMLEACNTSFQVHFQVAPDEFAKLYNLAQLVTAPTLAVAVNSPVLMKHRLWQETRVALFQQSVDSRSEAQQARGQRTRVSFGDRWVDDSVLEIIREDVARFRVVLATDLAEDPAQVLAQGGTPKLRAWSLHNGTVYRWNRPCYGVTRLPDGSTRPHLRIENRVLPAGPTPLDEMANAALFFGLMCGLGDALPDVSQTFSFDDARANFMAAARYGLRARLRWLDGRTVAADELVRELLDVARQGLADRDLASEDLDRYLGVIEERAKSGRTGAQWLLDSLESMDQATAKDGRMRALVRAMLARQAEGRPVHEWERAVLDESGDWREGFRTVGQIMTTDVFTVHPEDLVDLAANLMEWEHLRHVPVEDDEGRVVGILSHRALLRMVGRGLLGTGGARPVAVREIMRPDPVTATPEMTTLEAIDLMRSKRVASLPVLEDGRLVGIVTEHDFIETARRLLEEQLRRP